MHALKAIGIVACSSEGAALCYRTLCLEAAERMGAHAHPEVVMHGHSLHRYLAALDAGDWPEVAALMLDSARKLAKAGAGFLICPDNTLHQALPWVQPKSPLPWISIADAVTKAAHQRGLKRVGLLGTRWLVESEVYPQAMAVRGIHCVRPPEADREAVSRHILDDMVSGRFTDEALACCQAVIQRLKDEQRCDAVVLGCTELPLVLNEGNSPLPTLDSTRLLARAALTRALE
ncbi:aspartate/glutamate racemase family protein [Inhella gelatinilytica]|uniref:Amino acid racemase n=1 Tax=Inhella gelatinilytica TaxID=2795030 RepID=A0A931NDX5_9BURK|nr:amino acid racemase [Inhella gelatinilytica]MBH9551901.1 amino acid racemase [Inhella gelatinilytica]